ncbi:MAG TPA: hypothetical protein VFV81_08590, partial [Verrucomicrobiae bacterium]|nr:hypothetical protein [Verrucomicrobiae bacterium]
DGSLWGMGSADGGQLGDGRSGTLDEADFPEQIIASNVTAVAAGTQFTLFLKSDGSLWGTGHNYWGQLGDGTSNNTNYPECLQASNVVAVAAGYEHSFFVKSDGSLWGTGMNEEGELGDGTFDDTNRPQEIVSNGVVAVAASVRHSLFLKSDGSLWAMGYNHNGALGDGFTNETCNVPEKVFPLPPPVLTGKIVARTNLEFSATCSLGGTYYLLSTTNLSQPVTQWTRMATNSILNRASNLFTATITGNFGSTPDRFYLLQSP